jgi:hypothetical protein
MEYTNQFVDALDRIILEYPFLIDEVIIQIKKKNKRNEITIGTQRFDGESYNSLARKVLFYALDSSM